MDEPEADTGYTCTMSFHTSTHGFRSTPYTAIVVPSPVCAMRLMTAQVRIKRLDEIRDVYDFDDWN